MGQQLLEHALHRQMYIDLIRAYLLDYGTLGNLARALGISGPMVTYYLQPWRPVRLHNGDRSQTAFWFDAANEPAHSLSEALSALRTPRPDRARAIANTLTTDAARRQRLLHHLEMARPTTPSVPASDRDLPPEELRRRLDGIGAVHGTALTGADTVMTAVSYSHVWREGHGLLPQVSAARYPLERAQLLMFLSDSANVLNRQDLALAYARQATLILKAVDIPGHPAALARLQVNALLAEVVTLNNLGLKRDALELAEYAVTLPTCHVELTAWRRSFLEQALKSLPGKPRFTISEAQYQAERAREACGQESELVVGIDAYLVSVHLEYSRRYDSTRSLKAAEPLVGALRERVKNHQGQSILRRMRVLRVATELYSMQGDRTARDAVLTEALEAAAAARLRHQEAELTRYLSPANRSSSSSGTGTSERARM